MPEYRFTEVIGDLRRRFQGPVVLSRGPVALCRAPVASFRGPIAPFRDSHAHFSATHAPFEDSNTPFWDSGEPFWGPVALFAVRFYSGAGGVSNSDLNARNSARWGSRASA